ncbi:MAG TPA: hypothetical protein VGG41_08225 [Solirubrobacteraceae bacterium]
MSGLLFIAPALVLSALMLLRRYPGERCLSAIAARRRSSAPRAPRLLQAHAQRPNWDLRPRGSALLACALATRPPPAPARG